jgi:D-lactate dehydrogenase
MEHNKLNIIFCELSEREKSYLSASSLSGHQVKYLTDELNTIDLSSFKDCEVLSVFIYSKVDASVLEKMPQLRLIATRSTGFDHIDLKACMQRGIGVCNVPYYGENTVAEHTFGLILALSRNIHKAYLRTIRGDFSLQGLTGFDLYGKVIGVIGAGHIGLHVIRIARGFGMKAVAFDIHKHHILAEVLNFEYLELDELLGISDIITLHAPYNRHTHHMINRETLQKVKQGAIFINTSRGGLVDTDALVWALDKGILSGAGLDVLEGEELIKEEKQLLSKNYPVDKLKILLSSHILLNRENVVITPHIAFDSREALNRILDTTVDNIMAFHKGQPTNMIENQEIHE